jgi:hypothetical protein
MDPGEEALQDELGCFNGVAKPSRCVVVAIRLPRNQLAGGLNMSALAAMPYLERLDISHNPGLGRADTRLPTDDGSFPR